MVLDVGCGIGGPTLHIAKITSARIIGLNITRSQIEIAKKRAEEFGLSNRVTFDYGDAMHMQYPDNTFDAIVFFESICHMPNKDIFFAEAYRVIKPGGYIAGSDWVQCEDPTEYEKIHFIEPICDNHSVPALGSLYSYRTSMEKAGFIVHIAQDLRHEGEIMRNWELLDSKTIETFKSLPKGAIDPTMEMLLNGGIALSEGAKTGAFYIARFMAWKPSPRSGFIKWGNVKAKL